MKTLIACCAWAMLLAAPGHALAQNYTFIYQIYQEFTKRDARSFHNWLADNDAIGRFDKGFYSCLQRLEQRWVASNKASLCEAYPPGSEQKARCYGESPEGYLVQWSLSLRATLTGPTLWENTEIGRQLAAGEALCAIFGADDLCEYYRAQNRVNSPRMHSLLVC